MYIKLILIVALLFSDAAWSASIGWAVPISVLQEQDVLHVEFAPNAPKSGLPSCATRTFINVTTDAGKVRASLALAAFAAQKEVYVYLEDNITSCRWSSSVPSTWIRVKN